MASGTIYNNLYHFLLRSVEGKIQAMREYRDTLHAKEVLEIDGWLAVVWATASAAPGRKKEPGIFKHNLKKRSSTRETEEILPSAESPKGTRVIHDDLA